jgi:shikimate dehydrogenase
LCLGAGGAATALLLAVTLEIPESLKAGHPVPAAQPPERMMFTDVDPAALHALHDVADRCGVLTPKITFHHAPDGVGSLLESLQAGSLVVNATGLGKDRPGSPLLSDARFPRATLAWDFNYRGDLEFLRQARKAGAATVDGWDYFVAGWGAALTAIADQPFTAQLLARLHRAAATFRPDDEVHRNA